MSFFKYPINLIFSAIVDRHSAGVYRRPIGDAILSKTYSKNVKTSRLRGGTVSKRGEKGRVSIIRERGVGAGQNPCL